MEQVKAEVIIKELKNLNLKAIASFKRLEQEGQYDLARWHDGNACGFEEAINLINSFKPRSVPILLAASERF